mmetsp:Transcript_25575/g.57358  ORF Transcript_25575/g.57358 Transcript_25575/m.57358 type:complete len:299 (-) Transcript_25575:109-1005(-)
MKPRRPRRPSPNQETSNDFSLSHPKWRFIRQHGSSSHAKPNSRTSQRPPLNQVNLNSGRVPVAADSPPKTLPSTPERRPALAASMPMTPLSPLVLDSPGDKPASASIRPDVPLVQPTIESAKPEPRKIPTVGAALKAPGCNAAEAGFSSGSSRCNETKPVTSAASSGENPTTDCIQPPILSTDSLRRCKTLFLGTSLAELRHPCFGKETACPHMRCTSCDFEVMRVPDRAWTAETSYLSLRLHVPNLLKLEPILLDAPGKCAYACQCSWKTVDKTERVTFMETASDCGKSLKWRCAGH